MIHPDTQDRRRWLPWLTLVGLLLPAIFWNAGNMLLPCARLAFGDAGLEAAAIVFVTMAILTSTFGIWIAKGENGLREAVRAPLLYGGVGGAVLALTGTTLPRIVMQPIEMLASAMPPAVINVVFAQLYDREPSLVASSITLGTLLSVVTIPLVLYFVS